jgi:hypothetical protein
VYSKIGSLKGMVDPSVAANANVALYVAGIFSSLFVAPLTFKYLGNYSMFVGGLTYPLYMGSLWAYGVSILDNFGNIIHSCDVAHKP